MDAERIYRRAERSFRGLGDMHGLGKTFRVRGNLARERNQFSHANDLYREATALLRSTDDELELAYTLEDWAKLLLFQGAAREARRVLAQALSCIIVDGVAIYPTTVAHFLGLWASC